MDALTVEERGALAIAERAIDSGKRAWLETGRALRAIRDGKLYRETHDTFEDYLQKRWKISERRAYQMMDGASVFQKLNNCSTLQNISESHVRPLTKLDGEHQITAWQKAIDMAPKTADGEPQITARIVEQAVEATAGGKPAGKLGKVIKLKKKPKAITLELKNPERAALDMIQQCDPKFLVEFLSELGFNMNRMGMVNGYVDVLREWAGKKGVA